MRAKEQYLQKSDERYVECKTQLLTVGKELERLKHERKQLLAQAMPEHLQMVAVTTGCAVSIGDVIKMQGKC